MEVWSSADLPQDELCVLLQRLILADVVVADGARVAEVEVWRPVFVETILAAGVAPLDQVVHELRKRDPPTCLGDVVESANPSTHFEHGGAEPASEVCGRGRVAGELVPVGRDEALQRVPHEEELGVGAELVAEHRGLGGEGEGCVSYVGTVTCVCVLLLVMAIDVSRDN